MHCFIHGIGLDIEVKIVPNVWAIQSSVPPMLANIQKNK
jgi:hypothetical protein